MTTPEPPLPPEPPERPADPARALLARSRSRARAQGLRPGSPVAGQRRRPAAPGEPADPERAAGPAAGRRRRSLEPHYSGPTPDDRDPQPLGRTLDRLVAEHGWETDVAVAGVFARWPELVGREVAAHARPERFAGAVLTVVADSTAWATQLRLLAPQLLARLNTALGAGTVQRVVVQGPSAPSWRKGPRHVAGRGPRDTYG